MSVTVAVPLAAVLAAAAGLLIGWRLRGRSGQRAGSTASTGSTGPEPGLPVEVFDRVFAANPSAVVVLDPAGEVVVANPAARRIGAVRDGVLVGEELQRVVRLCRGTGRPQDVTTEVPVPRARRESYAVRASVVALGGSGYLAVFLDDITEARRLAAVRRDFVANISHELKTPVGALTLLGEAMSEASDDPDAVRRFAARMRHEGDRLGRLVGELIDLSRLEGAEPMPDYAAVAVDDVISEAVDQTRAAAESAGIAVAVGGQRGLQAHGDVQQLITAVGNLVGNAIAYSAPQTKVAIGTRLRGPDDARDPEHGYVEISVADQGIGIAEADLGRIFERFYRADPARSSATGGNGLGLAIVKHVATNHGGEVAVWSVPGAGSTFTLRLPAAGRPSTPERASTDDGVRPIEQPMRSNS